jgi:hypothetical protein
VLLVTAAAEPDHRELMLILRGRLWSQLRVQDSSQPAELAARLERCWERFRGVGIREPDHDSVDDMHILDSWLARHEGHPAILVIQERAGTPDWQDLAKQALRLREDQLDFEGWRKARDAGEDDWADLEARASVSVAAEA